MAKILIIDDDPDILLSVRLCLEGANHCYRGHNGAKEGVGRKAKRCEDLDSV